MPYLLEAAAAAVEEGLESHRKMHSPECQSAAVAVAAAYHFGLEDEELHLDHSGEVVAAPGLSQEGQAHRVLAAAEMNVVAEGVRVLEESVEQLERLQMVEAH